MDLLPTELLIHVFSLLDLPDRTEMKLVCKKWYAIIKDDHSWRLAFEKYFGSVPLRRCKASWELEYLGYVKMYREWSRKRIEQIQFDPQLGAVQDCLESKMGLLVTSQETGLTAKFSLKGKQDKTVYDYYAHFQPDISEMVVVGQQSGEIAVRYFKRKDWTILDQRHQQRVTSILVHKDKIISSSASGLLIWPDLTEKEGVAGIRKLYQFQKHIVGVSDHGAYSWDHTEHPRTLSEDQMRIVCTDVDANAIALGTPASVEIMRVGDGESITSIPFTNPTAGSWSRDITVEEKHTLLGLGSEEGVYCVYSVSTKHKSHQLLTRIDLGYTVTSLSIGSSSIMLTTTRRCYIYTLLPKDLLILTDCTLDPHDRPIAVRLQDAYVWVLRDKIRVISKTVQKPPAKKTPKKVKQSKDFKIKDELEEAVRENKEMYHERVGRADRLMQFNGRDHGMSQKELEEYVQFLSLQENTPMTLGDLTDDEQLQLALQLSLDSK
ncbi:hypothetical protein EDD86DRAFT_249298 [Gorgonomyces haynaldii]|nr:hypothetical protein EDD86DRAFT_249298 [Gorgonomyces haynaldii]